MDRSIFVYEDYKAFLNDWIENQPGRGWKVKLATTISCNTTYITHLLRGNAHLSLEQAESASLLLNLDKDEKKYFLLLVQYGRAGTLSLKNFLKEQMKQSVEQHYKLKNRLIYSKELSKEDQAIYYSRWYYSAILISLTISKLQAVPDIAYFLGLPENTVREALNFLTSRGLVETDRARFKIGTVSIHLGSDSPNVYKHHTNWRMRAIESMDNLKEEDLHYSSVISINEKDKVKVREIMTEAIEKIRNVVRDSKEDTVCAYNIDFFSLKKN